ncbi:protein kinase family protein [Alteribacillus sp. HJP-4]|uniref:protein kinase family protein n=1 Tax=Alteribacillus sp. HJP-4 TaxID=2775394 RepID=UPI0035CD0AD4
MQVKSYSELADSVVFVGKGSRTWLVSKDDQLDLIGKGRSAFAFRIRGTNKVLKLFFPEYEHIAAEESEIYAALEGLPFYPELYGTGKNFIVLEFVDGHTLFECLRFGLPVSETDLEQVDQALDLARRKGLNPSDIHLRNILITRQGTVKIIDVARYRQTKECSQWDDLKNAFTRFYKKRYCPKRIPALFLHLIAAMYKRNILPGV